MITFGASVPQIAVEVTANPASINANSEANLDLTVKGANVDMFPLVNAPNLEAGVAIRTVKITAADTVRCVLRNNTGSPIDPASQTFRVICL